MPDGFPPVDLGLSFLKTDTVDRRVDSPYISMDQSLTPRSFATYTSPLTSSVASSFSRLPRDLETPHTGSAGLNGDVLVSVSHGPVSASFAVDAALVAGSVSVLIGVGCMLGFICYKRKRHGNWKADFIPECRRTMVFRKASNDDLEASAKLPMHISDTESNDRTFGDICGPQIMPLSTSAQLGSNPYQLSTTKTEASYVTPLAMYVNQHPRESPALSATSTLCPPLEMSPGNSLSSYASKQPELKSPTVHGADLDGLQEDDLGSVVLSSLQINQTLRTVESRDDHFATSRSILPATHDPTFEHGFFLGSSCNLAVSTSEDGLFEGATFCETPSTSPSSLALSFDAQPLATPDSPTLSTMQSLAIPDSPTLNAMHSSPRSILTLLRYDADLAFHSDTIEYTKLPPRLLELELDSEVDLHSCLGLDREDTRLTGIFVPESTDPDSPGIPELVATGSQDTVTGTDESYDHDSLSSIRSYGHESQHEYDNRKPIGLTGDHNSAKSRTSVFTIAVTRSLFLHPITASPQVAVASIAIDNLPQARTLSPSPSFASSSTSVTTLQLPSYCAAEQNPLIEEVLPPPSIIVSVPTDSSLLPDSYGSAQFSLIGLATGKGEKQARNNRKRCSVDSTKVIYDPIDEVEEEAWGDTYERTYLVERPDFSNPLAMDESSRGFSESWMTSSESSELDIVKAIAKFPLPPVYSYSEETTVRMTQPSQTVMLE